MSKCQQISENEDFVYKIHVLIEVNMLAIIIINILCIKIHPFSVYLERN
jgi:hypothetical protein